MQNKRRLSLLFVATLTCTALAAACLCGCSKGSTSTSSRSSSDSFASVSEQTVSSDSVSASSSAVATAGTPYSDVLQGQLTQIANNTSMNVGIAFVDLLNPADACYIDADSPKCAASMIKLLILNEFYEQVNQGLVSRDEVYTLTGSDIVGGTGVLQGRGAGATVTFGEMADLMISQSDNTATNVLINRLGQANINARASALGLTGSSLNRMMMDTDAIANGIENYMSARDAATLLSMIYAGTFVDQTSSRYAISALEAQADNNGILAGLPAGTLFAHKTGTLSNAQNDAGIVESDHPYVISVFCEAGGGFSQGEAFEVMRQCGEACSSAIG